MRVRFFVCEDIVKFVDSLQNELREVVSDINEKNKNAYFIYSYSVFESVITEILRYYFVAFPEKLDKTISIDKEIIINNSITNELLIEIINSYIRRYSSDKLYAYLSFFSKNLSINILENISEEAISNISKSRNIIVHDNYRKKLFFGHIYNISVSNDISISDIIGYSGIFINILGIIRSEIIRVYKGYTKEKLMRSVWDYAFNTSLLRFDDIWSFDDSGALRINKIENIKENISSISKSEHLLLAVFLQQYNEDINNVLNPYEKIPMLVGLDSENKKKLVDIITFFSYYPLFLCGERIRNNEEELDS